MKIVFLDTDVVSVVISLTPIEALGELTCYGTTTPDEIPSRVDDCEVLIINKVKIGKPQIDAAPRLKLICEAATGVDNVVEGSVHLGARRGNYLCRPSAVPR